jgi:hypothetical protein
MRRSTTRCLLLLVALLIALTFPGTGRAAPITYTTSGDIGTKTGPPIGNFSFNPTSGTVLLPGTFSLGSFSAQALPEGTGLSYSHLPFYINVALQSPGPSGSISSGLSIQGELNGTITGTTSSTVVATLTSVQATGPGMLPFPVDSFNVGPQTLAPSGVNGGMTSLMGQVNAVPEPTPLAMMGLLAASAGLRAGIRRTRRSSR